MPGPRERVVLDTALTGALIERLKALRDALWRYARAVAALLAPLGRPGDPAAALRHGAAWADGSRRMLTRRLALVQAADEARGAEPPGGLAGGVGGAGGVGAPGDVGGGARIALTLPPDPFGGDGDAARAAGALLGTELVGAALRPFPDVATIARAAARLNAAANDPDLVAGFVGTVGPDRLAAVLHLAEGVHGGGYVIEATARGSRVHASHGGPRTVLDAPGRRLPAETAGALTAALGATLATFSRAGGLTAGWLGRFNARGEPGAAETTLLGPLLRHGRFAPASLRLLGDALFAGTDVRGGRYRVRSAPLTGPGSGGARDVSLFGGGPADARAGYAAALLRAIAAEPALAARFATDHVETVLAGSRLAALPPPVRAGVPEQVASAWAYLVGRAGGSEARRADPAGAATFVARLAFAVHQHRAAHLDQARHRDTSWPLPAGLRVAIGETLGVWREEMYNSATGLLPAADALRDTAGAALVTDWPAAPASSPARASGPAPASSHAASSGAAGGAAPGEGGASAGGASAGGPWSTHLAGPADGARIPAELWADLLGEALAAGGPPARALATDAALVARQWEQAQWAATRGYRSDGRTAYPASPRTLGQLRQSALFAFFNATLARTADQLTLRAELGAQDEARATAKLIDELAAIARAVKPTDPVGTLSGLAVSVPVAAASADLKPFGPAVLSPDALAAIDSARAAAAALPGWQAAYVASATEVWLRRADDPIIPVEVTDAAGRRRRFTGDPRGDGFITGPLDDFLDAADRPLAPERMSPAGRAAYLRWLASPALVANNDRVPVLVSVLPHPTG
ncbi:hypothetical protein [Pseudofrankia sp. EUN1h]|uniref:hypothetical protein n=1 Tax=Pseudofrankia sp. EUN1h TaxID=1834515 RepID=UPI0008DACFBE|nr:hypothetical protein [Pseudofrankia sp. EUN1h]OHV40662.1 hypothetical protein BCD49_09025 [Pseudofrankia sp. EUN1h]